jgi:two-component system KDP operon response regulator KdpE
MRRALVIAHDAQRGRHLALTMRDRGFAPALACSPRGAVAEARVRPPDVVLIDPPRDEPSGGGAAAAMRQAAPGARLFVVAGDPTSAGGIRAVPLAEAPVPSAPEPPPAPVSPAPAPITDGAVMTMGDIQVNIESGDAALEGHDLDLTPREAALLRALALNYGQVLTRDAIGIAVWGRPPQPGSRGVDVLVRRLRRKVDESGGAFTYIQTETGIGYRLATTPRAIRAA